MLLNNSRKNNQSKFRNISHQPRNKGFSTKPKSRNYLSTTKNREHYINSPKNIKENMFSRTLNWTSPPSKKCNLILMANLNFYLVSSFKSKFDCITPESSISWVKTNTSEMSVIRSLHKSRPKVPRINVANYQTNKGVKQARLMSPQALNPNK